MKPFKKGNFIRLKNLETSKINCYSDKKVNIFEILDIDEAFVKIHDYEGKISINEIEAIPINGKDDLQIYYDPIICASIVSIDESIPVKQTDYSYYYTSFKKSFYKEQNFQELIEEQNIEYVHEVQQFLAEKFKDNGLKIKRY
jgi:hypothetical protein